MKTEFNRNKRSNQFIALFFLCINTSKKGHDEIKMPIKWYRYVNYFPENTIKNMVKNFTLDVCHFHFVTNINKNRITLKIFLVFFLIFSEIWGKKQDLLNYIFLLGYPNEHAEAAFIQNFRLIFLKCLKWPFLTEFFEKKIIFFGENFRKIWKHEKFK